jgi:hypothetical protein
MPKKQGIALLEPKREPVSIEEITLHDFFMAFALIGASQMAMPRDIAGQAKAVADACMDARADAEQE